MVKKVLSQFWIFHYLEFLCYGPCDILVLPSRFDFSTRNKISPCNNFKIITAVCFPTKSFYEARQIFCKLKMCLRFKII